jgi:hypothetical protein
MIDAQIPVMAMGNRMLSRWNIRFPVCRLVPIAAQDAQQH